MIHLTDNHLIAQPVISGYKNLPAEPPELDQSAVPWLPFEENWNTGLFETNQWDTEGNGNWRIAGQVGNAAPSAEFFYSPAMTDYHLALTSRLLNATNLSDGDIYLAFDLKLSSLNPTGTESLKVQISSDTGWITRYAFENQNNINWTSYKLKISGYTIGKIFRVRFLTEGQNSLNIYNWMLDNIRIFRICAAPLNLEANINFPILNEVRITWDPPDGGAGFSGWVGWDSGINDDALGLVGGGTFSYATRFTPAQLVNMEFESLTKIRFFPYAGASFEMKVWTGNNAAQLVLNQVVPDPVIGVWNEVVLQSPVLITAQEELWFGFTVSHEDGFNPAGIDSGPAITGFGDMISLDGVVWESISIEYGLNYNWNLQGYIEMIGNNNPLKPQNNTAKKQGNHLSADKTVINQNRTLFNYDVYKNDVLLGSTSDTSFIDTAYVFMEESCYKVQAVYSDCMSDFTEPDCVLIVSGLPENIVQCYPVPAHEQLSITLESDLSSLSILDFNSIPVFERKNLQKGTLTVNTAEFRNGLYLIRAFDSSGKPYHAKFIIQH
ncbi:MAG: hypothetical protein JNL22_17535 [Bacteroidales bacterium]|nr:hypothetical protein [Bacteroidales bacterium]